MKRTYDALLTLGTAINEETLTLPDHVYRRLDQTAALYEESVQAGREPLVIVSGFQRARRVYNNNLLVDENGRPLRECDPMADYLWDSYSITAVREGKSASVADNLAYSKLILMEQPSIARACVVTLQPLQPRIQALAHKIFGNFCAIDVNAISTNAEFPLEAKFFGDHICMLKDMDNGDHEFIVNEEGISQWPTLGAKHRETCQYFWPDLESEPFTNRHPEGVMQALLADIYS
jgi:hypothetical protein